MRHRNRPKILQFIWSFARFFSSTRKPLLTNRISQTGQHKIRSTPFANAIAMLLSSKVVITPTTSDAYSNFTINWWSCTGAVLVKPARQAGSSSRKFYADFNRTARQTAYKSDTVEQIFKRLNNSTLWNYFE